MTKKERYEKSISFFKKNQPVAETELKYSNTYELLVAVILSAQCTDKRVNIITPDFFKKFPTPKILAASKTDEVFNIIKSCSYPGNKSKHLIGMAKTLINDFNEIVPDNLDELQKMPGVGRKTAGVIMAVAFKKPAMPVDTHVFRVSARIGLSTNARNPLQTEKQLTKHIPRELWSIAHHWLILHGRYICTARNPKCYECGLAGWCLYYTKKPNL